MKFRMFLSLILVFLLKLSIAQNIDVNPSLMSIDPYEYKLKLLGVKEIIEYKTYKHKGTDSILYDYPHMKYNILFDSIGRITSFKYDFDFNKDYFFNILENEYIKLKFHLDSSKIFLLEMPDSSFYFNYYEKKYEYDGNDLKSITIFNPSIYKGYIDGVYIKEKSYEESCYIRTINERGELLKLENFINDKLFSTIEYYYTNFSKDEYSCNLLTKTILKRGETNIETNIRYILE